MVIKFLSILLVLILYMTVMHLLGQIIIEQMAKVDAYLCIIKSTLDIKLNHIQIVIIDHRDPILSRVYKLLMLLITQI